MLESAAQFLDGLPWLTITVTCALVATPLILLHELGHCVAALRFTDGPVVVSVGRPKPLVMFDVGRVRFALHPLISLAMPFAGCCLFQPTRRRSAAITIALAGPAASALGAIIACALASLSAPGSTMRVVLFLAAGFSALMTIENLLPRTRTSDGIAVRSDGKQVLDLLRGPVFTLPPPTGGWIRRTNEG